MFDRWGCYLSKPLFLCFFLIVGGCASAPQNVADSSEQAQGDPKDPLEGINRAIWTFNWDYADKYVLRPVALAYRDYTPDAVRTGLHNVAMNFGEVSSIINSGLQGKFQESAKSTGRFVFNTTFGLLGWFDPASSIGLERNRETFDEVLGSYGVSNGPYLMLPVVGPSSVREEAGDFVDRYYWPLAALDTWPNLLRLAIIGLERRADLVAQEPLIDDAFDSYEFVKNAYFQNIEYRVYDGNVPEKVDQQEEAEIDDFLDEID
jgi:phospholipid-binding lipoprotein MlaA